MTDHDLSGMLALATDAAEAAATLLPGLRARGVAVAATKSSLLDIVTDADRAAEELIRTRILAARPTDGFIGEEGSSITGTSGVTWIVDPLDGTVNYLYEAGPYAVSIAAVTGPAAPDAWHALVGAVVVCTEQATYAAIDGNGATLDGRPIGASREDRLELALIATGFGYDRVARAAQAAEVSRLAPLVRDIRMGGSAATDLCLVASGRLDAYYERRLSPWDYAAGALIVREAGGVVEGPDGGTPDEELVLAAGPHLAAALREHVDARHG